jgi:predicted nucleic acid-binding protein
LRLIVDTTPLIARVEADHPRRDAAGRVLSSESAVPILSPITAAEIDYFLQTLRGPDGNREFVDDLAAGRFEVPCLGDVDFQEISRLNHQYRDLSPGIADLSIVVLAARFRTTRVLTFDQRHFRLMRPLQGGTFTLLPFDDDIEA